MDLGKFVMRVRANEDVTYAAKDYKKGDEFETENDMHAKLLSLNNKVVVVEDGVAQASEGTSGPQGIRRGRYNRRDMRATK